jgi:hypothetical protein
MSLARKLGLGTLCALAVAILTIVFWPASDSDKAREDGEQLGTAVSSLYAADTTGEVDAALEDELDVALDDLADGAEDTREDAPDVEQAFWDGFDSTFTTA